ncbi:MAG: regulatory protein RecX [Pseudomonadales bacterium]
MDIDSTPTDGSIGRAVPGGEAGDARAADEQARRHRTAYDRAVGLLAQREHSARELTRKLTSRDIDPDLVGRVVADLAERNLQSDERFAESFLHSRVGRGQGPLRIRTDLRQRGIDDELIDAVMTLPGSYWREVAEAARRKRFGSDAPADRREWTRQARFLAQRGFPSDLIYRVLGDADD